jgi:large subunit ribosomal protein L15
VNSNKSIKPNNIAINVALIEANFAAGDTVNSITLKEKGLIGGAAVRKATVKVLGNGDLTKKVTVEGCLVSASAADKISKAGGSVA